jgi:hypothetical protein
MELYLHTEERERELRSKRHIEGDRKLSQSDLSNRNCGANTIGGGIKISQSDLSNINTCLELASE